MLARHINVLRFAVVALAGFDLAVVQPHLVVDGGRVYLYVEDGCPGTTEHPGR
jgi:hypothetical protein